jgi:hypothetical protein
MREGSERGRKAELVDNINKSSILSLWVEVLDSGGGRMAQARVKGWCRPIG